MKRTHGLMRLFVAAAALLVSGGSAKAQDNVRGGREPIVRKRGHSSKLCVFPGEYNNGCPHFRSSDLQPQIRW